MKSLSLKAALLAVGVSILGLSTASGTASAQGLEFLHAQRFEGNKICFVDHTHAGTSGGLATRQAAEKDAIGSWAGFTALEYGNNWGSWRLAGSKQVSCSKSAGSWGCSIEARPCKPAPGAASRRARSRAKAR